MPTQSYLACCLCQWPRDPQRRSEENGYLVPEIGDVIHVEFEGDATRDEVGWLFGTLVLGSHAGVPKRRGWIPAWAVRRMRPPGPIKRRAWDGEFYSLSQWQEYYGDELGVQFWEEAPHS